MLWYYQVWHGLLSIVFSSSWFPSPGPKRWYDYCAFSLKRSLQAPYFTASLSDYMMLFLCSATWFKMPFFFSIYISLSCKMLFIFLIRLIHIISLRLSGLDVEILIYIYLNLGWNTEYWTCHYLLIVGSAEQFLFLTKSSSHSWNVTDYLIQFFVVWVCMECATASNDV